MAKKRKVNPYRRPATVGDVNAAFKQGISHGIEGAFAIFFSALHDKEGYAPDDLIRVWRNVESYSQDIATGDLHIQDLLDMLDEEAGLVFSNGVTCKADGWSNKKLPTELEG